VDPKLQDKYQGKVLPATLSMGRVLEGSDSEVQLVNPDEACRKLFAKLLAVLNLVYAKSVIFAANRWINHGGKNMDRKIIEDEFNAELINDEKFGEYVDKHLPFHIRKAALSSTGVANEDGKHRCTSLFHLAGLDGG
jgi:hypothetical protein